MLNKLSKELRLLAEKILEDDQGTEISSSLAQARELYEKLLVLEHLSSEKFKTEVSDEREMEEALTEKNIHVEDVVPVESDEDTPRAPVVEEEPPSLNDLFVPTFDGIKEDMSQKAEFRDTISLDETEKLFQTKKEEVRQLSLNDRLVGSSIQVGLNDRIAFVNKLFNFSQSDFNKVLSKLNDCGTKEEALNYFQYQVKPNYNWKGKEELEERLVGLIERKFL